jgi:tuftelin-interacting protein 11
MSDSSHHDDDTDSDQDLLDDQHHHQHRRQQHRKKTREEAIYGVFYDKDDNDDDDTYHHHGKGRRNDNSKKRGRSREDGWNIAPLFVKGSAPTTMEEKNDDDEEENDDIFTSNHKKQEHDDDEARAVKEEESIHHPPGEEEEEDKGEEEEETEQDKARAEELRKKQEAANEYFQTLLKRGKGERVGKLGISYNSRPRNSSTPQFATADHGFHGAAGVGSLGVIKTEGGETTSSSAAAHQHYQAPTAGLGSATGLGMQPSFAGLGMPTSFGSSSQQRQTTTTTNSKPEQQQTFVKDPNLGTWEKHTKGMGMKLLAKMGYKGFGGLGSKRRKQLKTIVDETTGDKVEVEVEGPALNKGISRPVEVVVRPNNLGLGYGNFKEATKLKNNQQIEAEVRGIDLEKKQKEDEAKRKAKELLQASNIPSISATESSALPSVHDILQQKAWKRGAKQSRSKKQRRTVIPYQELLKKQGYQPSLVIDMRGPSTTAPTTEGEGLTKEVPLGEELLHNVSLLLNTYENKVHSGSHFVRSTQQKVESLQADISNMEQRLYENQERAKKLSRVLETVDQIEGIVNASSSRRKHQGSSLDDDLVKVQSLVRELQSSFTLEELSKLRFFDVLAPSLLEPVIQARLEHWDPLKMDAKGNIDTMEAVISFCKDYPSSRSQDAKTMMKTIFTTLLLPRVRNALESAQWDPIHDTEVGLQLYESICHVADVASPAQSSEANEENDTAAQIFPSGHVGDAEDDSGQLKDLVHEQLIHTAVYFRLQRTLSYWKPSIDEAGTGLMDRPDLWILPWILHLDHRSILPTLLSDCKRKLKSAISFLQKVIDDDEELGRAVFQTVRPWCNVFPKDTIGSLVSTSVVLRMAKAVATAATSPGLLMNAATEENAVWSVVDMTFDMHSAALIGDNEMQSIIEGELLSRWAKRMHMLLHDDPCKWKEAAEIYIKWRIYLFSTTRPKYAKSRESLQRDSSICSVFYAVLLMIQAAEQSNQNRLDALKPTPTNCRAVLARRMREERERVNEEMLRMDAKGAYDPSSFEARVRASQRHVDGHMPSFREVVEEFAREHDIVFQPRMGANATKDGKPVFLFGKIPIYLESDVAFAYQNSAWRPTSLGQLATIAQQPSGSGGS